MHMAFLWRSTPSGALYTESQQSLRTGTEIDEIEPDCTCIQIRPYSIFSLLIVHTAIDDEQ